MSKIILCIIRHTQLCNNFAHNRCVKTLSLMHVVATSTDSEYYSVYYTIECRVFLWQCWLNILLFQYRQENAPHMHVDNSTAVQVHALSAMGLCSVMYYRLTTLLLLVNEHLCSISVLILLEFLLCYLCMRVALLLLVVLPTYSIPSGPQTLHIEYIISNCKNTSHIHCCTQVIHEA